MKVRSQLLQNLLPSVRRVAALGALMFVGTAQVHAQSVEESKDFPVERFHLSTDRNGLLGVEWAGLRSKGAWEVSLWVGLADDPLVVYQENGDERVRVGSLVSKRIGGELALSYTLTNWLQLSASVPLVLHQTRDTNLQGALFPLESLSGTGLGDIRLAPKLGLLRQSSHGLDLSLMAEVGIPSGSGKDYRGDDGLTGSAQLLLSRRIGMVKAALGLGYLFRPDAQVANQLVDDELTLRAGVGVVLGKLELDGTISAATAAKKPFDRFNQNHAEFVGGPSYELFGKWIVFAAGGVGISPGFGTPDYRVLAGLRVGRLSDTHDRDADGIRDENDSCPREAEDNDSFKDLDGCPDVDNDTDGLRDGVDKCPNEPEDKDGFEDEDGCPDPDKDGDNIADSIDQCPSEPETPNGQADDDGCPDTTDADGDGVQDAADLCPTNAEDIDAFEDADGCPELDNDKDTISDTSDRCPGEAGPRENAGCPDADRDGDTVVDRLDNCPDEAGRPAYAGCKAKQRVRIANGRLDIMDVVHFKFDRDEILAKSYPLLNNVAEVLAMHPEILGVEVQGHTDDRGNDAYNLDLSDRRAKQVVKYLVGRGVAADRLSARGYGESQPIESNKTKRGRGANRRVIFLITNGVAAGVELKNSGPTIESADK